MLKQVCIYAENKKGTMKDITGILKKEGINIWGSVTYDSTEYGVIRMIVSDPQKTCDALAASGFICKQADVLGVEVADEVGNLNHLLNALYDSNINVNYIYLSFNRESGMPVMIMHTEDIAEVEECLEAKGFSLL